MRNLTVKREKTPTLSRSFYVCIADENSAELKINGTPCRLLGRLENGGESVFEIPDGEVCVYVFETKHSREYTYDMVRIPAGEDDVELTGRSVFNPATSASFRFDAEETDEMRQNRETATKKAIRSFAIYRIVGIFIGVSVILLFVLILWLVFGEKPETFSINKASITLTNSFGAADEYKSDHYVFLSKKDVACQFFEAAPTTALTVDGMKDVISGYAGLSDFNYVEKDGLRYLTCSDNRDEEPYFDAVFIYDNNGIYVVWFMTPENNAEAYLPDFIKWAKTVKFE